MIGSPSLIFEKEFDMKKISFAFGIAALGLVACTSQDVLAATATATMEVSATVEASCSIETTPLSFGIYRPTDTAGISSHSAFTLRCSDGAAPNVSILKGHSIDAAGVRTLVNAGNNATLDYVLYQPETTAPTAACNTSGTIDPAKIWGETTDVVPTGLSFAGSSYNICGFLGASQNKPAGLYTDTVTVSVNF